MAPAGTIPRMTDVVAPHPDPAGPARTVRQVHVLPHTHWDREWYEPYPTFRLRLLDLLDELLPRLDADPAFSHFQLDGQMAVVDDYLALRPGETSHIEALARAGRLSMGPWYVLPDEFLVSGETHVRNLQLGLRRAADFGGAMQVGYLPDMFGHVAQMPQLLALFGFDDAVVWRGVPSTVTTPAFRWESPDGSSVRAEYLASGYFNGSQLPADPDGARAKVDLFRSLQGPRVGDPILLMAGMDHEAPPEHLTDVIAAVNAADADPSDDGDRQRYHLHIGPLEEYLRGVPRDDLPVVRGELRSGARANLLMGVASNRVDVKQAAARAERTLERVAEPLAALWLAHPDRWRPVLAAAWLDVIRNAAHDSICACSHDEVVDAVMHRYAEATRLAQGVADRAVAAAVDRMAERGAVVLNATARPRTDVVELDVPGDDRPGDEALFQVLQASPSVEEIDRLDAADAPLRLAIATMADHPGTRAVRIEEQREGDRSLLVATLLPQAEDGAASPADALAIVGRRCAETPDLQVRLVLHRDAPTRHVLTLAAVPGHGWARWEPVTPTHPVAPSGTHGLTNGVVTVVVDPTDGTFSLNGVAGYGRLVDDGDAGDTYNWCPAEDDVVVDRPVSVDVSRPEVGPLRGRLVLRATYRLPERCVIEGRDDMTTDWSGRDRYQRVGERVGEVEQVITTTIELRADDGAVRVDTAWDQRARDHRLRVHLPLPQRTDHSEAEDAYAVVHRPLWAEGGPNEWGLPTFPSRRFVRAGGLTITHEGLLEYELVDLDHPVELGVEPPPGTTAATLALTLVRSTGWLSRGPMPSRPEPAGPFDRLEGAEVLKPLHLRYALQPDDTPLALDPHALADHVWNPLLVAVADGGGDLGGRGSLLPIGGTDVEVDAVLRDDEGRLVVRAHNTGATATALVLAGRTGQVVDLQDRDLGPFDGSVDLGPHRIVTVRVDGG
jgi:mannosylglycerate hydrolase